MHQGLRGNPFSYSDSIYIPGQDLSKILGVKFKYNEVDRAIMLASFDKFIMTGINKYKELKVFALCEGPDIEKYKVNVLNDTIDIYITINKGFLTTYQEVENNVISRSFAISY